MFNTECHFVCIVLSNKCKDLILLQCCMLNFGNSDVISIYKQELKWLQSETLQKHFYI